MLNRSITSVFIITLFLSLCNTTSIWAQTLVTRGPYLQRMTSNSVVIKWRTNTAVPSKVNYGISSVQLTQQKLVPGNRTEHEVLITGLQANQKYFYNISSDQNILQAGPKLYFQTNPTIGSDETVSFLVLGDCGTGNNDQRAVRDAFTNYLVGKKEINGILLLGDNAYDFGTDGQYQDAFFENMYEDIISNKTLWPCPGNHDYYSGADASTQSGTYYNIFAPPVAGEAGGYPSGTKAYYSFTVGDVHFISLDSHDSSRDSTGAQANWLKLDLAQNTSLFTVVFFHHAPYTKGSHNSDNPFPFIDGELPEMREQIIPILERFGVDLVLCGHSHSYERSYLMNGHYGKSNTLQSSMILQNQSGVFPGACPYHKKDQGAQKSKGTIYTVCGVAGKKSGTSNGWPHPMMHKSSVDHLGAMHISVTKNRLDAKFITSTGAIFDQFTLIKNAGNKTEYTICQGEELEIPPSYPGGNYSFFPGGNTNGNNLVISPPINTTIYGRDPLGCIKDTFVVQVIQHGESTTDNCGPILSELFIENKEILSTYPNPWNGIGQFFIKLEKNFEVENIQLYNLAGVEQAIQSEIHGNGEISLQLKNRNIPSGTYILNIKSKTQQLNSKIIITP